MRGRITGNLIEEKEKDEEVEPQEIMTVYMERREIDK